MNTNLDLLTLCPICGKLKELSAFGNNRSRKGGKQIECKECRCIAEKKRRSLGLHKTNPSILRRGKSHAVIKAKMVQLKGGKCVKCGLVCSDDWPSCCFDFHHTDRSVKEQSISNLIVTVNNGSREGALMQELEKCELLCANCHRKEHATT